MHDGIKRNPHPELKTVEMSHSSGIARNVLPVADVKYLSEKFCDLISLHLSHERYLDAQIVLDKAIEHVKKTKGNPQAEMDECLTALDIEELNLAGVYSLPDCVGRLNYIHRLSNDQKRRINAVLVMQNIKPRSRSELKNND